MSPAEFDADVDDSFRKTATPTERRILAMGLPFAPRLRAAEGDVVVLEHLGAFHQPPPWRPGDADRVAEALEALQAVTPPSWLPRLPTREERQGGWTVVADDPRRLLRLDVCGADWLEAALPVLTAAEQRVELAGDAFCHGDLDRHNVFVLPDRAVLVDWEEAAIGSPAFDLAALRFDVRLTGGALPGATVEDEPGWCALLSGYLAVHPTPRTLPDLPAALQVTAEVCGLPAPHRRR